MGMNKQQKLRNTAEGLLAGLAVAGFRGPWRWAHHQWEGAFYRAWNDWPPSTNTAYFREFQIGGSANGRTSQARDILFAVTSTSPFDGYDRGPLNASPCGLSPEEYLAIHVQGATPHEWTNLARALLKDLLPK